MRTFIAYSTARFLAGTHARLETLARRFTLCVITGRHTLIIKADSMEHVACTRKNTLQDKNARRVSDEAQRIPSATPFAFGVTG